MSELSSATPPLEEPSAWVSVEMAVNGQRVAAEVESRLLLSDFIRQRLRLTGTHVGCEHGVCGACTVLIDGQPSRSCLVLAAQADGASIRTIESVAAPDGELSPVQRAFHECHGMQCGFCTSGLVMTVTALAHAHVAPTRTEIEDQLSGHLCRCTGYANIRRAVSQALGEQGMPEGEVEE